MSGEEIVEDKGQGKCKEQCENSWREDNEPVLQGNPEQCENLEDKEKVWQLEKEAVDAVARAAAAVSGEIENK